jgi:hypothetical protein
MDNSHLKNFIDSGITVGFHGHQHKTELIHEYSNVIEQKRLLIFSAGTLCGGPKELPPGNNRQYNVIEIERDTEKTIVGVNLHVREKTDTSNFTNPIWAPGRIDSMLVSHHSFQIEKPPMPDKNSLLLEIEKLMQEKSYAAAKSSLITMDLHDDFVRKFLVECILQTEDFSLAMTLLNDPKTDVELITLLNAAIRLNDKTKMAEYLSKYRTRAGANPAISEMIKKMEALIK